LDENLSNNIVEEHAHEGHEPDCVKALHFFTFFEVKLFIHLS